MSNHQLLKIAKLHITNELQARQCLNKDVINDYAEALESGCMLPPVEIVDTTSALVLVDGFHRLHAYKQLGRNEIPAVVTKGTNLDALKAAISANAHHGLQRSRQDKAKAVEMALDDFELEALSDREIAEMCSVSHTFVAKQRRILANTPYPNNSSMPASKAQTMSKVATLPPRSTDSSECYEAYDPRDDVIEQMAKDLQHANDRLAVEAMDFSDEEMTLAAETLAELREEVRKLQIINASLVISRDQFQNENAQLKKQVNILDRKLKDAQSLGAGSSNHVPF